MNSSGTTFAELVLELGIPESIVGLFASYPYAIIFAALLMGGGIILFPAFYLSILGALNPWAVVGAMVGATVVADTFWYAVGRGILPGFFQKRMEQSRSKYVRDLSHVMKGKELLILFYSKFIYGTRIATQVMCGSRKVSFLPFIGVNIGAVFVLAAIYYAVVRTASLSIDSMGEFKYKIGIALAVSVVVLGGVHFLLHRYLLPRMRAAK